MFPAALRSRQRAGDRFEGEITWRVGAVNQEVGVEGDRRLVRDMVLWVSIQAWLWPSTRRIPFMYSAPGSPLSRKGVAQQKADCAADIHRKGIDDEADIGKGLGSVARMAEPEATANCRLILQG